MYQCSFVQVGLIVTRNGKAEKLSDLSGKLRHDSVRQFQALYRWCILFYNFSVWMVLGSVAYWEGLVVFIFQRVLIRSTASSVLGLCQGQQEEWSEGLSLLSFLEIGM